jgi:large subunit ribosomal protein L28
MGMQCALCAKKPVRGNQKTYRGKAKYLGGVGKKITGISRRVFKPNLQRIQIVDNDTGPPSASGCACSASAPAASPGP